MNNVKLDSSLYTPLTIQLTFASGVVEVDLLFKSLSNVCVDYTRAIRRVQRKRSLSPSVKAMTLAQLEIDLKRVRSLRDEIAVKASEISGKSIGGF